MHLGFWELAVILVIVLVLFGAGRLPEVFAALGQGVKNFRDGQRDPTPEPPRQLADPRHQDGSESTNAEAEKASMKQAAGH